MSEYGGTFEEDFFPDTKIEHLKVDILNDMWRDLQEEIAENSWTIDEGLRFILAAGLAELRAERQREQAQNMPEVDLKNELDRLQRQRMQIDGRYSVMKFRTYQFLQDAKTLAIQLNICRTEVDNLRRANELLRKKLEDQI